MPHFRLDGQPSNGGDELQTEYYVSREHGVQALEELRVLGAQISPHLLISEIRTAPADTLWLSQAYERDVLCIGFTWAKHPAEVAALLPVIEEALAPYAPRPHWGKLFHFGADVIAPTVPPPRRFQGPADPLRPGRQILEPLPRTHTRGALRATPTSSTEHPANTAGRSS